MSGWDPLQYAGFIDCHQCHKRTYPGDATWLACDLVLVAWQPGCWHIKPSTQLVVPSLLEPVDGPEPLPRPCGATVRWGPRRGQPCRLPAVPGGEFCTHHRPDRQATP